MRVPSSKLRAAFAATLIIGCGIGPAACASGYATAIPAASSFADPHLRQLARSARAGDKDAQLALGIRFEAGLGVARDLDRAVTLYRLAAGDDARFTYIHSPAAGRGQQGQFLALRRAPELGLLEAKQRLSRLLLRIEGDREMTK
jgi:TPR repeat protein